jgi:quinolinate synthase
MADMAPAEAVRRYKAEHPDVVLVAYVNSTAAVKAEVDICCTSGNAERIVAAIPADKTILFLPDQNLGANIARNLGRKLELWPGFCPTHNRIMPEAARQVREAHPGAVMLVHPECTPAVVDVADHALSTGGMLKYVRESDARAFIIGTECGILHRMRKENPGKELIPLAPLPLCPNMKKITLESIVDSLESMQFKVELDPALMDRARLPIERMLAG